MGGTVSDPVLPSVGRRNNRRRFIAKTIKRPAVFRAPTWAEMSRFWTSRWWVDFSRSGQIGDSLSRYAEAPYSGQSSFWRWWPRVVLRFQKKQNWTKQGRGHYLYWCRRPLSLIVHSNEKIVIASIVINCNNTNYDISLAWWWWHWWRWRWHWRW